MRGQHKNHRRSGRHYRWSGDRKMITKDGYVKVRVGRTHPLADPNGYAYEHLVVWCAAGRERPPKGWLLHHDNEIRDDNRLENLILQRRGAHNTHHNAQRGRDARGRLLPAEARRAA